MTDHEHAATGPGPGPGPRPAPGTGPTDAAPAATQETGAADRGTAPRVEDKHSPDSPDSTDSTGSEHSANTANRAERTRNSESSEKSGSTESGRRGRYEPPVQPAGSPDSPGNPAPFRRERRHKLIAGVCAGLARQTDMDPVIFRITLAVLSATGGFGLIFYGFVWLLVPYDDEEENEVRKLLTGRVDGQALAAVLFALIGCGVFLTMLQNTGTLAFAAVLSLLLAGAGYWSRHRGAPDPDPLAAQAAADAPPEAQAPPVVTAYPSWWRDPIVKDGSHVGGTGYLWGPGDAHVRGGDLLSAVDVGIATPWTHPGAAQPPRPAPPKRRGPRWIGGPVFLLALLAGGLGTGLTWNTRTLGDSLQTGLACALAVFGLGIAVSALLGRTGAGTVFLAVITAVLLAGAAAMPEDITTHWRVTSWTPTSAAQVRPGYELGTGRGTLDLTRIRLAKGQTVATDVHIGAGRLKVIVPADATVRMNIEVGVGDIKLPGQSGRDLDVQPDRHRAVTLPPAKGGEDGGTLDLSLQVGAGEVEVDRAAP
ncbi:PspC domain-containing protein [Streptomyces misionensis]|uniref:PspC domain-containing protein n=1 Tax=Streptomyces misionensis TaxID=67331 RepID=A0A5C6K1G1_9ACTN|nr:PspC domain-containing protein [Streptomyces misionensis]TWV56892.1 PspC domain-containing protein [Streptomyces misionensis]